MHPKPPESPPELLRELLGSEGEAADEQSGSSEDEQLDLFGRPLPVEPSPASAELVAIAQRQPPGLHLGTSSWTFPGWVNQVFAREYSAAALARDGLRAYASHPLYRLVGLDRTFYRPLYTYVFRTYATQVPATTRFIVKAHQLLTMATHEGEANPLFLDSGYAQEAVIGPAVGGLKERLAFILFQFPPQDPSRLGGIDGFINRLYRFLRALPTDVRYAVEIRTPQLLTERLAQALLHTRTLPALAGWNSMPSVLEQATLTRAHEHDALFVRWILHQGFRYEEARARYQPFDRLVDPDPEVRAQVTQVARIALAATKPAYVLVGNQAEGSAPLTLEALARSLAQ